jgi:ribosomal protein L16/L10AE
LEAGKVIFELNNVVDEEVEETLTNAAKKLPIPVLIVRRKKPRLKG